MQPPDLVKAMLATGIKCAPFAGMPATRHRHLRRLSETLDR
jgi:hypothetical protein